MEIDLIQKSVSVDIKIIKLYYYKKCQKKQLLDPYQNLLKLFYMMILLIKLNQEIESKFMESIKYFLIDLLDNLDYLLIN
jgi:hypothetical protein